MRCINMDMGSVDLYFADIAENLVDNQAEADFLEELASQFAASLKTSTDDDEKKFAIEGAAALRAAAAWFRENSP